MTQPPHDPPSQPPNQPPNQPYGQPAQPGQPPYGQPQQSPYGQPEVLGQAPYGQPPKKKRTGVIIGAVVGGVVVLVLAVVLAVTLMGGDDDGEGAGGGGDNGVAMSDEQLQGDGYSYDLPEEWEDISDVVLEANPGTTIDSASAWGSSIEEARGNVIVENPSAGGVTDIEEAREQLRGNLEGAFDAEITDVENREIGGVEFAGLNVTRTNEQDIEVEQTAWISIIDDVAYVVTVSREADDDEVDDSFEAIFDSWSWE